MNLLKDILCRILLLLRIFLSFSSRLEAETHIFYRGNKQIFDIVSRHMF